MPEAQELERSSRRNSLPNSEPLRGQRLTYGNTGKTFGEGFGLPAKIYGDPLGCGCWVAHLAGVGPLMGNELEADYQCDSGWHNYVVFQVSPLSARQSVKIDVNGNVTTSEGFSAGDLEEY